MKTQERVLQFLLPLQCSIVSGIIAGAAVAGAVGGIAGAVVNANNAKKQRQIQEEAAASQRETLDEQLSFQEEQYADWEAVYGPVRENLAGLYQDLTPELFAATGLERLNAEYGQVYDDFQRDFAQRGIDSPAQTQMQGEAAISFAEDKAKLRNEAPLRTAAAQQQFLSNQVRNPVGNDIANNYSNQANLHGQQSAIAADQAARYDAATQSSVASVASSVSSGVSGVVANGGFSFAGPTTTGNVTSLGLTSSFPTASANITPSFQGI